MGELSGVMEMFYIWFRVVVNISVYNYQNSSTKLSIDYYLAILPYVIIPQIEVLICLYLKQTRVNLLKLKSDQVISLLQIFFFFLRAP